MESLDFFLTEIKANSASQQSWSWGLTEQLSFEAIQFSGQNLPKIKKVYCTSFYPLPSGKWRIYSVFISICWKYYTYLWEKLRKQVWTVVFVPWKKFHINFHIRSPKMCDYKAQIEWVIRVINIVLKMLIIKWEIR